MLRNDFRTKSQEASCRCFERNFILLFFTTLLRKVGWAKYSLNCKMNFRKTTVISTHYWRRLLYYVIVCLRKMERIKLHLIRKSSRLMRFLMRETHLVVLHYKTILVYILRIRYHAFFVRCSLQYVFGKICFNLLKWKHIVFIYAS